jgi:hypothetical protein
LGKWMRREREESTKDLAGLGKEKFGGG